MLQEIIRKKNKREKTFGELVLLYQSFKIGKEKNKNNLKDAGDESAEVII